jgi:hypothetical protein
MNQFEKKHPHYQVFIIAFFLAKFKEKGYEIIEGGNIKNKNTIISNKFKIMLKLFESYIYEYSSYLSDNKGKSKVELTLSRKQIVDEYGTFNEQNFSDVILNILSETKPVKVINVVSDNNVKVDNAIRYFNNYGNEIYITNFETKFIDEKHKIPHNILFDKNYTNILEGAKPIDSRKIFPNRFEFGKYLYDILSGCDVNFINDNENLWNWITCLYFKNLFPGPSGGKQKARYVLSNNTMLKYRHLVREAWKQYAVHREDSIFLLSNKINYIADECETAASNNDIVNQNFLRLCRELYMIKDKKNFIRKKNVTATNKNAQGTLRRLVKICKRLSVNYYIKGMKYDEFKKKVLSLDEFSVWN